MLLAKSFIEIFFDNRVRVHMNSYVQVSTLSGGGEPTKVENAEEEEEAENGETDLWGPLTSISKFWVVRNRKGSFEWGDFQKVYIV